MDDRYTLEASKRAGLGGNLREWCIDYLRGPGKNIHLAQVLEKDNTISFTGPVELEITDMKILVGPPGSGLKWTDTNWEENIASMMKSILNGWSPPPLMYTDYWDPEFHITDGSHRVEALRRLGYKKYWTIVLKCTERDSL